MTYLKTFKREFQSIFNTPGMMILLFVGPVFLTLFMGGVYVSEYVNDIPMAILDEDQTSISRMIDGYFADDDRFRVVAYPDSRQELQALIDSGEVHAGLWIPQGMSEKATGFQGSEVLLIVDGTNLVVANNAYAQAATIIQTLSAGIEIKLLEGKGLSPLTSRQIATVINAGERILYDSKLTYMVYLIFPFLGIFLQQLYMSSMGSLLIRHRDELATGNAFSKVMAASTSVIVAFVPAVAACMFIIRYLYDVTILGSILSAILMTVIFLTALTGPALILASLTKDRMVYSQFSLMLSVPTFVMSGAVWLPEMMPRAMETFIRLVWPVINYAKPVQEMLIKNRSIVTMGTEIVEMLIYGVVYMTVGLIMYRRAFGVKVEDSSLLEGTEAY